MNLSATVKRRALEIGFDLAGVAPLAAWKDLEFAHEWVERGFGGEMRYLQNPKRDDPRRILPSVRSVVCVGLFYNAPLPYSTEVRSQDPEAGSKPPRAAGRVSSFHFPVSNTSAPRAWISRYAWGRDYHLIMRAKLEELRATIAGLAPGVETRVYVDTGPVLERAFARFSGIGWTGKNTCLINEGKGSWFFIGVILTNLELEPDLPAPDRCGSCTRCLEACPTGALVEPYVMDASRCISYLTIELKGSIPVEFREGMGANIFGCDICQDVCPWNGPLSVVSSPSQDNFQLPAISPQPRRAATTGLPEFQPMHVRISRQESATADPGSDMGVPPVTGYAQGGCTRQEGASDTAETAVPPLGDSGPRTPDSATFSLFNPPLESLASLTEDDFRRLFADSPIKRAKYRGWLRNLCVAMGNSGDRRLLPWVERACTHEDPVIREHAQWAAARLKTER